MPTTEYLDADGECAPKTALIRDYGDVARAVELHKRNPSIRLRFAARLIRKACLAVGIEPDDTGFVQPPETWSAIKQTQLDCDVLTERDLLDEGAEVLALHGAALGWFGGQSVRGDPCIVIPGKDADGAWSLLKLEPGALAAGLSTFKYPFTNVKDGTKTKAWPAPILKALATHESQRHLRPCTAIANGYVSTADGLRPKPGYDAPSRTYRPRAEWKPATKMSVAEALQVIREAHAGFEYATGDVSAEKVEGDAARALLAPFFAILRPSWAISEKIPEATAPMHVFTKDGSGSGGTSHCTVTAACANGAHPTGEAYLTFPKDAEETYQLGKQVEKALPTMIYDNLIEHVGSQTGNFLTLLTQGVLSMRAARQTGTVTFRLQSFVAMNANQSLEDRFSMKEDYKRRTVPIALKGNPQRQNERMERTGMSLTAEIAERSFDWNSAYWTLIDDWREAGAPKGDLGPGITNREKAFKAGYEDVLGIALHLGLVNDVEDLRLGIAEWERETFVEKATEWDELYLSLERHAKGNSECARFRARDVNEWIKAGNVQPSRLAGRIPEMKGYLEALGSRLTAWSAEPERDLQCVKGRGNANYYYFAPADEPAPPPGGTDGPPAGERISQGNPKPQFHPSSTHKPQWPEAFECSCGRSVEPEPRPDHPGDCVLRCECGASRSQLLSDAGNVKTFVKALLFADDGSRSGHIECWRFDPAYTYTDKAGERHERKTQQSDWQGHQRGTALYRKPASDEARVLVAEGEKACAAIADRTESDGVLCYGASSYARSIVLPDWIAGRECVLLPDNDVAGDKAINVLGARLVALGCTVKRTVHDQAAPQGHDAADMTEAELAAHLDTAAPFEPMDKPPERPPATQMQAPHANGYVLPQTMQARMVKLWDSCEVKDGHRNEGAYRFVRACLTLYEYQDVDWETFLWSRARDIGLPAVEVNGIIRSVRKTAVRETQAAFDAKKDEWKRSQP